METSTIVLIIVIALVVLIGIGIAVAMSNRGKARQAQEHAEQEQQRTRAQELRQDAVGGTGLQQSEIEAREAQLAADRARLDAEQAHARAQEVEHGHLQQQAQTEEQLREADRLDPDVDTRSENYTPVDPSTSTHSDPLSDPHPTAAPSHRDDVPPSAPRT